MIYLRSGELRSRIAVHAIVETQDSFGQAVVSLSSQPIATAWAKLESLDGSEQVRGEQVAGVLTHRITTRWQPSLANVGSRVVIVMDGKRFGVESVTNVDGLDVALRWLVMEIRN